MVAGTIYLASLPGYERCLKRGYSAAILAGNRLLLRKFAEMPIGYSHLS